MIAFTVTTTGSPKTPPSTIPLSQLSSEATSESAQVAHSNRIVVKFGGTSLADSPRVAKAASIVAGEVAQGTEVAIVVSAMGGTTDHLLNVVHGTTNGQVHKADLDDVLAMGERTSVRVFAAALRAEGLKVRYFDPSEADWPILTDSNFSDANPLLNECEERIKSNIAPLLEQGIVPVLPGFIGRTTDGRVSTIGRGGSDTTAFILAKALNAREVVIVTESDGILTADPALVPKAKRIDRIDVQTLVGLADSGTKFIHRKALRYKSASIPVRVISIDQGRLRASGTTITGSLPAELDVELASQAPAISVTIAGKAISENPRIVEELVELARKNSSVLGFSADFNSMILYLPQMSKASLLEELHAVVLRHTEAVGMAVRTNLAFLRIIGVGLEETPGLIARISEVLRVSKINIFGILTLASSILLFVSWEEKEAAFDAIKSSLREAVR